MKNIASIFCFCIALLMCSCASSGGNVNAGYEGRSTNQAIIIDLFWLGDAEKAQPRFSPEGQEYIKVSLAEAVRQSRNPGNRDKELFFETGEVMVKHAGQTGNYYVSSFSEPGEVGMEFYGEYLQWQWFSAVLYRVRCLESGVAIFSIDSFVD